MDVGSSGGGGGGGSSGSGGLDLGEQGGGLAVKLVVGAVLRKKVKYDQTNFKMTTTLPTWNPSHHCCSLTQTLSVGQRTEPGAQLRQTQPQRFGPGDSCSSGYSSCKGDIVGMASPPKKKN